MDNRPIVSVAFGKRTSDIDKGCNTMNEHVLDFYSFTEENVPKKKFFKVILLHDCPDVDWDKIHELVPGLSKGWHELCQLSTADRIQFTLDYWLAKLPYHPHLDTAISKFFSELDDVSCFASQKTAADPIIVEMVYSVSQNRGFYRGASPASDQSIIDLQKPFLSYILPEDYLAFLQIHNGFWKATDCTGIKGTGNLYQSYQQFQNLIGERPVMMKNGKIIDPKGLIPFYESFGMPYYQCFWDGWHHEQEMGNVYYSGKTNTISDVEDKDSASTDKMAFPTFLEWLIFYLEQIDI
jgi:hypothetical protein